MNNLNTKNEQAQTSDELKELQDVLFNSAFKHGEEQVEEALQISKDRLIK